MKQCIFFLLLCVFHCIHVGAQTTQEEYNYVSNGLLDNFNKGQDLKQGYKLVSTGISERITIGGKWRNVEILYFKKSSNNRIQAFAVDCTDQGSTRRIMCIPTINSNQNIWNQAFEAFRDTGDEWHVVFMWAFMKLSSSKLL
ncbi:MAG: hypothetical protein ACXVMS_12220 [Flavisolibacter sp.]